MKKWKSECFRPRVPDKSQKLRERFCRIHARSGMTLEAFSVKIIQAGMDTVEIGLSRFGE
ncbi:MAG: hypothetical protein AB7F40_11365 [Victivallaceae bacterium]